MWRSIRAVANELRVLPNVKYLTIGLKRTGGRNLGTRSVNVYVERKASELKRKDSIPEKIPLLMKDGSHQGYVDTDVIELQGEPTAFGIRAGHLLGAFDSDQGVCALSFTQSGREFLITNSHVACDVSNGQQYGQMTLWDRLTEDWVTVGNVLHVSELTSHRIALTDVAIIEVEGIVVDDYMILDQSSPIARIARPSTATAEEYWYVVNGQIYRCKFPERVVDWAWVNVDGVWIKYQGFLCRMD